MFQIGSKMTYLSSVSNCPIGLKIGVYKLFWDWTNSPGGRVKNVVQIGAKMLYLGFQLSDWAEIWGVQIFLNYIATSKVEPML